MEKQIHTPIWSVISDKAAEQNSGEKIVFSIYSAGMTRQPYGKNKTGFLPHIIYTNQI